VALEPFVLEAFEPYYWLSAGSILFETTAETTTVKYPPINPPHQAQTPALSTQNKH